jgi:hypothetical protein
MLNPGPTYIAIWLPIIIVVIVILSAAAYFLYKRKEITPDAEPGVMSIGQMGNDGSYNITRTNLNKPIHDGSPQPIQNESPRINLDQSTQMESPQPIHNGSPLTTLDQSIHNGSAQPTQIESPLTTSDRSTQIVSPQQPIIQSKSPNRTYKYRILSQCLSPSIKDRVEINFIEYMDPNATNIFILYHVNHTMIQSLSDYVTQNLPEYEIIYHNIKADYYTCMIIQKNTYSIGGNSFHIRSTSYISNVISDSNIAISGIDCIAPHNNCNTYDNLITKYTKNVIGSKYISVDPDELDNTFRDNNLYYKSNGKKGAISIINNKNKDVKISVINMYNNTNYSDILVADYDITV